MASRALRSLLLVALLAGGLLAGDARAEPGLARVVRDAQLPRAHRAYFLRHRVSERAARWIGRVPLVRRLLRHRQLYAASNENLSAITRATKKGYLEVIFPADRGHVFYRLGDRVFDFYDKGFRAGPVRPIKSDRYGFLVRITEKQEKRLAAYFQRLEQTAGKELGRYDFHGEKGFHCVTFMLREQVGERPGEHLVKVLGGNRKDGRSMPKFARFMQDKAKHVEGVVVYKKDAIDSSQLAQMELALMSSDQLRKARKDELRAQRESAQSSR